MDTFAKEGDHRRTLTRREREVLERLAADGASNREIGRALYLDISTIKAHMGSAMRKLNAHNRTHLALMFKEMEDRDAFV